MIIGNVCEFFFFILKIQNELNDALTTAQKANIFFSYKFDAYSCHIQRNSLSSILPSVLTV